MGAVRLHAWVRNRKHDCMTEKPICRFLCLHVRVAAPEEEKRLYGLEGREAIEFTYVTADGAEAESIIEGKTVRPS